MDDIKYRVNKGPTVTTLNTVRTLKKVRPVTGVKNSSYDLEKKTRNENRLNATLIPSVYEMV